jgi:hypothetical protein
LRILSHTALTGPAIYIYGHTGPAYGSYSITIDSKTENRTAHASANGTTPTLLYANDNLPYAFHTVTLKNLGDQAGGSNGKTLLFDYLQTTVQLAPQGYATVNGWYKDI